jgi:hypothetical protein
MFEVLKQDGSDDEGDNQKRPNKQQQRADDKQKREAHGDVVKKDNYHNRNAEGRPDKNTWGGEGKRTHERQSGTGGNTFNKAEKKGGAGGKGNWGQPDLTGGEEGVPEEGAEGKDQAPEEPVEPVVTLDDYMKDNNMNLNTAVEENQQERVQVQEKGFKQLAPKQKEFVEAEVKQKNADKLANVKTNIITGAEPQGGYRGNKPQNTNKGKPAGKKQLNNDDFPTL